MNHAILFGDTHIPNQNEDSCAAVWNYHEALKPKYSIHVGDLPDFEMFSRHTRQSFERTTLRELKEMVGDFLSRWRQAAKGAQLWLLEGNHDWWGERWAANQNEALEGVFRIPELFDLKKHRIKFFDMEAQRSLMLGPVQVHHGSYCGVGHARQHLRMNPGHQIYGHVHKGEIVHGPGFRPDQKKRAMSLGCLCNRPIWQQGRPNDWEQGFGELWWDRHGFDMSPIHIEAGRAIVAGQVYGEKSQ